MIFTTVEACISPKPDEIIDGVLLTKHTIFLHLREVSVIAKEELLINEEIKADKVRLVGADGTMLGIVDLAEALKEAEKADLDLVDISPKAEPPVCKIMDYGKYVFDMTKREKDARKNQKVVETKEVRLTLGIEDHDLQVKLKNAKKFLAGGDKVKVTVKFYGREMNFTASGEELINKVAAELQNEGDMEKRPKMEGRRMTVMFSPKAAK